MVLQLNVVRSSTENIMGLIEFIIICVIVGLIVWAVTTLLPMPKPIKTVIMVAAVLVLLLFLVRMLGVDVQI